MTETREGTRGAKTLGTAGSRQRKMWWLLPLAVLFLLVGIIYVLGHMGSADSEMYPTTERRCSFPSQLC